MCLGSRPRAPAPAPRLPEAPRPPDTGGGATVTDIDRRRRAAATGGGASTILTGPRGVTSPGDTATKTLLGG